MTAGMKIRGFFIFVCLFFILGSLFKIAKEGVVKNSLLDEFYLTDSKLLEFKEYSKHFEPFSKAFILVEKKDKSKIESIDYVPINNGLVHIFRNNKIIESFYGFDQVVIPRIINGDITLEPLVKNGAVNKNIDMYLQKNEKLRKFYFSDDSKALRFPLTFKEIVGNDKDYFIKKIFQKMNKFEDKSKFNLHLVGPEVLRFSIFQEILKIQKYLLPVIIILISTIMWFLFRSIKLVTLSLVVLGFSFISSAGLLYFFQEAISAFSTFSLMFVFIIGTSDIVHLLLKAVENGKNSKESFYLCFIKARDELIKPCFLTTMTTMVGLLSLVFSPLKTLHQFGVNGCVGMGICFVFTFLILPELLSMLKFKCDLKSSENKKNIIKTYHVKYHKIHLAIGALVFLICIPSLFSIKFQDDFFNKFTSEHPFSKAVSIGQKQFKNLSSIDLVGGIDDISSFEKSKAYNQIMELDEVSGIYTSDQLYDAITKNITSEFYSKSLKENFKYLIESNPLSSSLDSRVGRIQINLVNTDSITLKNSVEKINQILRISNFKELKVSGYGILRQYFADTLSKSYLNSLLFTFLIIFIIFWITYRSFKLTLLAMIPNIVPPLVVIYAMNIFGIKADMNIALICSMTLAISVDDTIHFFHKFLKDFNKGSGVEESVKNTLDYISKPLIGSSLIISMTLLVFTLGDIILFSQFSVLLSLALLVALYYDLIILPALIVKLERFI